MIIKNRKWRLFLRKATWLILSSLLWSSFSVALIASETTNAPLPITVSIQPQVYFVERIGGNRVEANALIPPGKGHAALALKPAQMVMLSNSKIYFRIGVPFEEILIKKIQACMPQLEVVNTSKGVKFRKMQGGGIDPHIWLDPVLVKSQSKAIYEALVNLDPSSKAVYKTNLDAFIKDLDLIDSKLRASLDPIKGSTMFVFHPAYGYFADRYGLKQLPVEVGGKAPKGKELAQFIKLAKEKEVRVIFVQPQFDQNTAQKIAEAIDGAVIPLDPLAKNYIQNLEFMANEISKALAK
jgi:zinc transport system substrate-binding protein